MMCMVDLNQPIFTPTEWRLLCVLWEFQHADAGATPEFLRNRFGARHNPKTTGILLSRLAAKGYLRVTLDRRSTGRPVHIYSPALSRDAALRAQFSHFLSDHAVQAGDAEALRSVLDRFFVVVRQVPFDGRDQFLDAAEDPPAQSVLGQITEEPLDHVEP
jgi:predicted transcriptional regulator